MSKFAFKPVGAKPTDPVAAAKPVAPVIDVAAAQSPASPPAPSAQDQAPTASPASPVVPAVVPQSQAVVPVQPASGAVTEYRARPGYGDDSDGLRASDIKLPRINIVKKVGPLSEIFTPGDVVLNQEIVIYKSDKIDPVTKNKIPQSKPLRVVVAGFRPDRYAEKTEGGDMGNIFDSIEEVVAAGGTIDYNEAEATAKPPYQLLSECLVLIEKPEDVDSPEFSYIADGKKYAAALWANKGGDYTNGGKIIRTARKAGWLKDDINPATKEITVRRGYPFGIWEITTTIKQYRSGNFSPIPVLRRPLANFETSPELRALATSLVG